MHAPPLSEAAAGLRPRLVDWRRHLHRHPELSGREKRTAAFVSTVLSELGLQPREGVGGHGVTAEIGDARRGGVVALRADMDALPIHEETGAAYASTVPGVMHACGHDAHVAMLLGAAALLKSRERELRRPVRLIFQPHEEVFPGGAPGLIAAGVLDGVERIFGIHICSSIPTGLLGTRPGPFMAAVNPMHITIRGRGGHAAMPHEAIDPVLAAAQVIVALQTVVSRSLPIAEPSVVSVTQVAGGTADNIIPEAVELAGTIRTFTRATRELAQRRVREIVESTARAFGATAEVRLDPGYPSLVNDARMTEHVWAVARAAGIPDQQHALLDPQGGGEDFAYYLEKTPGVFVFLGAGNAAQQCCFPHHHPRFDIDEDALPTGAALHAQFALAAE
jgi:amidohydrolase